MAGTEDSGLKTQLQTNFQAGVDGIYNAIVAQGTTPASKSQSDVQAGIGTLSTNRYNDGVSNTKKGTATAAQVLSGYTFTSSSSVGASGSMTNQGSWNGSCDSQSGTVTVPAGYHNGSGTVSASAYGTQRYYAGVSDADARVNTNSASYSSGYNSGYNTGKSSWGISSYTHTSEVVKSGTTISCSKGEHLVFFNVSQSAKPATFSSLNNVTAGAAVTLRPNYYFYIYQFSATNNGSLYFTADTSYTLHRLIPNYT